MRKPLFSDYVQLEQVRLLETDDPVSSPELDTNAAYEHALLERANRLTDEKGWTDELSAPGKSYRFFKGLLLSLVAVLGLLAVANALAGAGAHSVINIYWLLLVLLGFNTLSLLLWGVGCVLQANGLIRGSVGGVPLSMHRLVTKARGARPAYAGWWQANFGEAVGLWRLSTEGHRLWLVYLSAGLAGLLVLFSVRQFDFVWGSTLLSPGVFVATTDILAKPLTLLGAAPPDAAQVLASQSGETVQELTVAAGETRRQWALFLIGSLTIYGLLPRALCFALSSAMLRQAQRHYRPDFYLPYYVELQHRHQSCVTQAEVVDPDQPLVKSGADRDKPESAGRERSSAIPMNALSIGVELDSTVANSVHCNVIDRKSLDVAVNMKRQRAADQLLLVVNLGTAPDRGMSRRVSELATGTAELWLMLHRQQSSAGHVEHLASWYQVARDLKVPVDRVLQTDASLLGASSER
ncbi:MAG: DUF2868 domain-containing protein [Pseudomonadales bacterium]